MSPLCSIHATAFKTLTEEARESEIRKADPGKVIMKETKHSCARDLRWVHFVHILRESKKEMGGAGNSKCASDRRRMETIKGAEMVEGKKKKRRFKTVLWPPALLTGSLLTTHVKQFQWRSSKASHCALETVDIGSSRQQCMVHAVFREDLEQALLPLNILTETARLLKNVRNVFTFHRRSATRVNMEVELSHGFAFSQEEGGAVTQSEVIRAYNTNLPKPGEGIVLMTRDFAFQFNNLAVEGYSWEVDPTCATARVTMGSRPIPSFGGVKFDKKCVLHNTQKLAVWAALQNNPYKYQIAQPSPYLTLEHMRQLDCVSTLHPNARKRWEEQISASVQVIGEWKKVQATGWNQFMMMNFLNKEKNLTGNPPNIPSAGIILDFVEDELNDERLLLLGEDGSATERGEDMKGTTVRGRNFCAKLEIVIVSGVSLDSTS
uniref:Uncharacterized protein n=1 Tax=Timema monikensis TaxID=170555 RepID=A0A7R9E3R0_9NEOP|nr:unnamed protein product [Timema monikensis]